MAKAVTMSELFKKFSEIPTYVIEVGVFAEKTERDKDKKTTKKDSGLTNAEILFINEEGSAARHIPPRPVLLLSIEDMQGEELDNALDRAIDGFISSDGDIEAYEKELKRFTTRVQSHTRNIIKQKDPRLPPNAASVAEAKGGNYPLHNTGQLERSIQTILRKVR